MKYVALLRGINVGGNNRIEMARLKSVVEELGYPDVRTYINSGNVVFDAGRASAATATTRIEQAIENQWGKPIKVLLRSADQFAELAAKLPDDWRNDSDHKCDVMFLWDDAARRDLRADLPIKQGIDDLILTPGEIIWRVARPDVTRSGMMKLVGTPLYARMTVRNVNTVRKLAGMLSAEH